MPLPGGATDKIGNRYEGRWTVHCIIEILAGRADSIRLEPPGKDGEGVEFWLRRGQVREYYQVKRQNSKSGHWSLADLDRKGILAHFWKKLKEPLATCYFVSTHSAFQIDELGERVRQAASWDEFESEFLQAKDLLESFKDICHRWECSTIDAYAALERIFVHTIGENLLQRSIERELEVLVKGNPANVAAVLGQFALDEVHHELTATDIRDHLNDRGYPCSSINRQNQVTSSTPLHSLGKIQDGIIEIQQRQSHGLARIELLLQQHLMKPATTQANTELENPWQTWLKQAEIYYDEGDIEKAFTAINQAWELDNQILQIISARGCILAEYAIAKQGSKSMFYEAIGLFESLRGYTSEPAGVEYNIGNCYTGLDEHDKAIKCFDIALTMDPRSELAAQIWKNRGTSYFHLGNQEEEILSYKKALELDPSLFEAYASWGAAKLRHHDYQNAKELLEKAFDVAPKHKIRAYPQLYSLAYALWKLEDFEDAYSRVNQVLAIQPTHQDGLLLKAYLLRELWPKDAKYIPEAIAFYENWVLDNPEGTAARNELYLIYQSDKYQHNPRVVLEQTALSPNPPVQALYNYALLLGDEDRTKEAIKYLEMAFQKSREHHIVHKLGIFKEKESDYPGAIRFYKLALEDVSDPTPILHGIADCYHFLENYTECIRVTCAAILIAPQDDISWMNLMYSLEQLKRREPFYKFIGHIRRVQTGKAMSDEEIKNTANELLNVVCAEFGDDFIQTLSRYLVDRSEIAA